MIRVTGVQRARMKSGRGWTVGLVIVFILVFASVAVAQVVLNVANTTFTPGQARSNGAYSNIYTNEMGGSGAQPLGIYQRYSNGSNTRIKNDFASYVQISGDPIYTQGWCKNPSGPGGPTVTASCVYINTV